MEPLHGAPEVVDHPDAGEDLGVQSDGLNDPAIGPGHVHLSGDAVPLSAHDEPLVLLLLRHRRQGRPALGVGHVAGLAPGDPEHGDLDLADAEDLRAHHGLTGRGVHHADVACGLVGRGGGRE